MKFCIVGNGFTGATLPLANEFAKNGYEVDCYYIVNIGSSFIESLDFDEKVGYFKSEVAISKNNKIYKYLDRRVNIFLIPIFKRRNRLEKLLIGKCFCLVNKLIIQRKSLELVNRQYDYSEIIVHTDLELSFCRAFSKFRKNFAVVFHEVLYDHLTCRKIKSEVEKSFQYANIIIVHSKATKDALKKYAHEMIKDKKIYMIHFGTFDSYLSYDGSSCFQNLCINYNLYLGYIKPYKGIGYLYETSKKCKNETFVIAGAGNDSIINEMQESQNVVLINRYLTNDEIVSLIRHCKCVILPYLSASQSGVVQTALAFNKPIIASDVGSFSEMLDQSTNSYLIPPANSEAIADAIRMLNKSDMLKNVSNNVKFKWDYIFREHQNIIRHDKNNKL